MTPEFLNHRDIQVIRYRLDTANIINVPDKTKSPLYARALADPMIFERPDTHIYWERQPDPQYRSNFQSEAEAFKGVIVGALRTDINGGVVGSYQYVPLSSQTILSQGPSSYLPLNDEDITDQIISIKDFTVDMDFNNSVRIEMALDSVGDLTEAMDLQSETSPIQENDLIEIRMQFEDDDDFSTEFIGFVSNISDSVFYGAVRKITFTAFGIQKMLGMTKTIRQPAICDNRLIRGIEINNEDFNGYQTIFQGLTANEIFNKIVTSILAYHSDSFNDIETADQFTAENNTISTTIQQAVSNIKAGKLIGDDGKAVTLDTAQNIDMELADWQIDNAELQNSTNDAKTIDSLKYTDDAITNTMIYLENNYIDSKTKKWSNVDGAKILSDLDSASNKNQKDKAAALAALGSNPDQPIQYTFNPNQFTSTQDFRVSFLTLYSFYKLRLLLAKEVEAGILAQPSIDTEADSERNRTGFEVVATIENGGHTVYNAMTASGYEKFFAQLTPPVEVLGTLKKTTFYDLFTDRIGNFYMRPPRYNYIETDGSGKPVFLIENSDIKTININRQDVLLKTHVDTKWMMPFIGVVDFPTGSFTDFNVLFKYGMRLDDPTNNPNVINQIMGGIFSALVLNEENASTRTAMLQAYNKKFFLGRLYVIKLDPSQNNDMECIVGYLDRIETVIKYGEAICHSLTFKYVREFNKQLVDNALVADMAKLYNPQILSAYVAKLATDNRGNGNPATAQLSKRADNNSRLISSLRFDDFLKTPATPRGMPGVVPGDQIRAMKRLPSILDVQLLMDADPKLGNNENPNAGATELPDQERASSGDGYLFVEQAGSGVDGSDSYIIGGKLEGASSASVGMVSLGAKDVGAVDYIDAGISLQDRIKIRAASISLDGTNDVIPGLKNYGGRLSTAASRTMHPDPNGTFIGLGKTNPNDIFYGIKTPFSQLSLSATDGGYISKRMVKSMFLVDMALKKSFPMFHGMDNSWNYENAVPEFIPPSNILSYTGNADAGSTTLVPLQQNLLNKNSSSKISPIFSGAYFSTIPTASNPFAANPFAGHPPGGPPPGTIMSIDTSAGELSESVTFGLSEIPIYIINSGGGIVTIYDKNDNHIGALPVTGNNKLFFASPYFEINMERMLQLGWAWRAFMASGDFTADAKEANYNASNSPHCQGRAIDNIFLKTMGASPLIPGVLDANANPPIMMFRINDLALQLISGIMVKYSDRAIAYSDQVISGDLSQLPNLYFHSEVKAPSPGTDSTAGLGLANNIEFGQIYSTGVFTV